VSAVTPVTTPVVGFTVAADVFRLTHTPPGVVVLSVVVAKRHRLSVPVIGAGVRLTVTTAIVLQPVTGKE
jgi:hypothetical protein